MGKIQDDHRMNPITSQLLQCNAVTPCATVAGATTADIQAVATVVNNLIAAMKSQGLMK